MSHRARLVACLQDRSQNTGACFDFNRIAFRFVLRRFYLSLNNFRYSLFVQPLRDDLTADNTRYTLRRHGGRLGLKPHSNDD
jgi:hypothetical protein